MKKKNSSISKIWEEFILRINLAKKISENVSDIQQSKTNELLLDNLKLRMIWLKFYIVATYFTERIKITDLFIFISNKLESSRIVCFQSNRSQS